jgi:AmmeMemoRadiSam system protein A
VNEHGGHGDLLACWARAYLVEKLGGVKATRPEGAWGDVPGATFVTLRWKDGDLHGCVGSLTPRRGIVDDAAYNAVGAALHDPRSFPAVLDDLPDLDLELSVLSPLEPVAFHDETSALAALRPGKDGIVFTWHGMRSTFLPIMWERLGTPRAFMEALKEKAGLAGDFWADDVRIERYTVEKFASPAPSRAQTRTQARSEPS